jgi:hypothetical protein
MWDVNTKVITIMKGATETISKSFRKYPSNISGKNEISYKKSAILDTAHILRRTTDVKAQNIQHGEQRYMYHKLQPQKGCNVRHAKGGVCFKYKRTANTLHKGDCCCCCYYYYYYYYYYHHHHHHSLSSSPLCRVFILIFLRQTMSLGNTVSQPFCCSYSWCIYH